MNFEERLEWLKAQHEALINRKNEPVEGNGIYERYKYPILTGDHAPLTWRYDLNMEKPSNGTADIFWSSEWRAQTGNPSSQWRKVRTVWIISVSGTVP